MNRSRAALFLTALLVVVGLLGAGAGPAGAAGAGGSPIRSDNHPTPLAGQVNAQVDPSQLIGVQPGCLAARAAASSLALLLARANADGIALSSEICYRSLADQLAQRTGACTSGNCACAAVGGTSNHGWGKAIDFLVGGISLTSFSSPAYQWLKANAGRYGWNHPAAEDPGATCPEAWHWEWVGDGGTLGANPIKADVVSLLPAPDGSGYLIVTGLGAVSPHGSAQSRGSADQIPLNRLVVATEATRDRNGYWLVASDGGIFAFGDAVFFGSTGGIALNQPIVGMAATPSGNGYWLVAADGGIFAFGDASFFGSTGGLRLNQPVVGMAATPSGKGYFLVASDGGIFAFGDAPFSGSLGGSAAHQPIVSMGATPTGNGYWLLGSEGAVYPAGDAADHGSFTAHLNAPTVSIRSSPSGGGYWLLAADGGIFNYGDAPFLGTG